jgi:selenocysteine lyase/cysteine desulfurase
MPILAFTSDRTAAAPLAALLEQHGIVASGGLQCAPLAHRTLGTLPDGVVRLSVGPETSSDEIDAAIEGIQRCLSS